MQISKSRPVACISGRGYARAALTRFIWLVALLITAHAVVAWLAPAEPCLLPNGPCGLWQIVEAKLFRPVAVLVFVLSLSSLTVRRLRDAHLPAPLILLIISFLLKDVGPLTGIVPMVEQNAGLVPYVPAYLLAGLLSIAALTIVPSSSADAPRSFGRLAYVTLGIAIALVVAPDLAMLTWAWTSAAAGAPAHGWTHLLVQAMQWRLTLNPLVLAGVVFFALGLVMVVAMDRRRAVA